MTEKSIKGTLNGKLLLLELFSTTDLITQIIERRLEKISDKPNLNLDKIFGKITAQRDSRLIGKWEMISALHPDGKPVNMPKITLVLRPDGDCWLENTPISVQDQLRFTRQWETIEGELYMIVNGERMQEGTYKFSGDTLSTFRVMGRNKYVRKK